MNLNYIVSKRTNGANPFNIFLALEGFDKETLASAIKRLDYPTFLETAYWFAVSTKAKSAAGMRCQVCNGQDRIQVHHRTYATHGYEHLHMNDLTVLDENCHGLFHGHIAPDYIPPRLTEPPPQQRPDRPHMKGRRGRTIVPHTEADLQMPDGDPIVLTKALIQRCMANGSFTNATLRAFGLTRPLTHGWPKRLLGVQLTREKYLEALKGRFSYNSGPLAKAC